MNAAEVVVGEMQTIRGPQILEFLAKRIGKARQPANRHPKRQILSLDVAGTNSGRVRISEARNWDRLHDFSRAVELFPFAGSSVHLHQLREVYAIRQCCLNCGPVRLKSVSRDLKP